MRDSFSEDYMSLVEINDFNALSYSKPFFDKQVKNKQEASKKLGYLWRNNDYTTGNLLDYLHKTLQSHWYRFIQTKR